MTKALRSMPRAAVTCGVVALTIVGATGPASASPGTTMYPVDRAAGYAYFDDLGEHFHMYDTKTNGKYIWISWGLLGTDNYHTARNNSYYRDLDLDLPEGEFISFTVCEGTATTLDWATCGPSELDLT